MPSVNNSIQNPWISRTHGSTEQPVSQDQPNLILNGESSKDIVIVCVSRHGINRLFSNGTKEYLDYGSAWHNKIEGVSEAKVRIITDRDFVAAGVVQINGQNYLMLSSSQDPDNTGLVSARLCKTTNMVVEVSGKVFSVIYERDGLDSSARCVAIVNSNDQSLPVWDLYTNVPVDEGKMIAKMPNARISRSGSQHNGIAVDLNGVPSTHVIEKIPHDIFMFNVGDNIAHMSCGLTLEITGMHQGDKTLKCKVKSLSDDTNPMGFHSGPYKLDEEISFRPSISDMAWVEVTDRAGFLNLLVAEDGTKRLITL